jgi:hypothetical protein
LLAACGATTVEGVKMRMSQTGAAKNQRANGIRNCALRFRWDIGSSNLLAACGATTAEGVKNAQCPKRARRKINERMESGIRALHFRWDTGSSNLLAACGATTAEGVKNAHVPNGRGEKSTSEWIPELCITFQVGYRFQ